MFADDTRFLSRWVLTVNGVRPATLSTDDVEYFEAQFFLALTTSTVYVDSELSVFRRRIVDQGAFQETISIINHSSKPITLDICLEARADFADLFEVKDALKKKGEHYSRMDDGALTLGYRREAYSRETRIS